MLGGLLTLYEREKSIKTFPETFRYVGSVAREENISGSRPLGVHSGGSGDIVDHMHRVKKNSIGCPAGKRWKLLTMAFDRRRVAQEGRGPHGCPVLDNTIYKEGNGDLWSWVISAPDQVSDDSILSPD